ncbi:MAG: tetratricopeptide repeat protein, partial [Planctomycetes bacterium]|nr:tetratricopeptide repeat protein [Planctomycetota bacterium]
MQRVLLPLSLVLLFATPAGVFGQEESPAPGLRGSLVEDRAARKLLDAGSARYDADEIGKAVEVWQSVIERYPRSRVRFAAHLLLGDYFLERDRSYDRARLHFEAVADEENREEEQRAEAALKVGVCYYHAHNYGRSFQVLRAVIARYPVSPQVNEAYYYIGLGHFHLGHYSRAISSLEKVGTALTNGQRGVEKLEAGKRLFVKIEDADLAVLGAEEAVEVRCEATSGDVETLACRPVGRNVRLVLGSIPTRLGKPAPGNGHLEIKGDDQVTVTYTDQHTAEQKLDQKILAEVTVVGSASVRITDGAFAEPLRGVVLGKSVNVQITDADHDLTDKADSLRAVIEVHRLKTEGELEAEAIEAVAAGESVPAADDEPVEGEPLQLNTYKQIDRVEIALLETPVRPTILGTPGDDEPSAGNGEPPATDPAPSAETPVAVPADTEPAPAAVEAPAVDDSIHTGVFRTVVLLQKAEEVIAGDAILQALPGDLVRVVYLDEKHRGDGIAQVRGEARCLEGNIGGVRVTRAMISDEELRI